MLTYTSSVQECISSIYLQYFVLTLPAGTAQLQASLSSLGLTRSMKRGAVHHPAVLHIDAT